MPNSQRSQNIYTRRQFFDWSSHFLYWFDFAGLFLGAWVANYFGIWNAWPSWKHCDTVVLLLQGCLLQLSHLPSCWHQIGGVNSIVEIDESLMARRKYHRAHQVPERWVFGGIDSATNIGFLVIVPNRTAATLLPLVEQFIAPGTMTHSNRWGACSNTQHMNVNPPYRHNTVNHTENFVDPVTRATTNHVGCIWKTCKSKFKSMNGVHSSMLSGYLDEFMWRQRRGRTHIAAFGNIFADISEWYPTL